MNQQIKILNQLYELQEEIGLVSHINFSDSWRRIFYLSEEYDPKREYNHRNILDNEVVIEFDEEDEQLNKKLADQTCRNLDTAHIAWAKWTSGNKSTHVHFFINPRMARRIDVLKRAVMKFFGTITLQDTTYRPDYRLAANNHLIRLEYGVHENTGKRKQRISSSGEYPKICELPAQIWEQYATDVRTLLRRKTSTMLGELSEHDGFKYILATHEFKEADDGRERAMFMLIHVLKGQYEGKKQEFIDYIKEWYRYSGGRKLNDRDIENKVNYHWNRNYTITEQYLNNLLYEVGREDLIKKLTPNK